MKTYEKILWENGTVKIVGKFRDSEFKDLLAIEHYYRRQKK